MAKTSMGTLQEKGTVAIIWDQMQGWTLIQDYMANVWVKVTFTTWNHY